eukprot:gene25308-10961_t
MLPKSIGVGYSPDPCIRAPQNQEPGFLDLGWNTHSGMVEAFLVGLASVPANGSAGTTTQQSAPKPGTGHSTPAGAHPYQASSPSLPKRRTAASAHAPPEKPPIDENAGTPEQRATVKSILAAKDFYEILSLQKGAGDEDIRKSYRKSTDCYLILRPAPTLLPQASQRQELCASGGGTVLQGGSKLADCF